MGLQSPYTGVRFPTRPQDFKKSGQNRYARVRVPSGPPENTECFLLAREKRAYARFVGRRKPERCASCRGGERREVGSRPSARKRARAVTEPHRALSLRHAVSEGFF